MAFTNTCGFFHCIFVMNVSPTQKKKKKKKKSALSARASPAGVAAPAVVAEPVAVVAAVTSVVCDPLRGPSRLAVSQAGLS